MIKSMEHTEYLDTFNFLYGIFANLTNRITVHSTKGENALNVAMKTMEKLTLSFQ